MIMDDFGREGDFAGSIGKHNLWDSKDTHYIFST